MENKQSEEEDAYNKCPSFSSYSSDRLSEIAVRVAAESSNDAVLHQNDDDFEFAFIRDENDLSTDDLVSDGTIATVFPVFNRDLLLNNNKTDAEKTDENTRLLVPLSQLFIEEREFDNTASCSSSEADELETIPAGTYCVWRPKAADQPPCNKSKSTGSNSKRWKFRDLLRSNSEGKDRFVFLTPKNHEDKKLTGEVEKKAKKGGVAISAHEALYVRNRAMKEGDKKKSFLPYRRDLVGFFVSGNGSGKSLPRF